MNGFTIYKEYYDLITLLSEKDQQELLLSIMKYMFEDIEPNLNDKQMKIFSNLKRPLDKSKKRSKASLKETSNQNQNKNKIETNQNQNEIKTKTHQDVNVSNYDNNYVVNDNVKVNNNLNYQHKEILELLESNGLIYFNTPDEFNVVDYLSRVDREIVEDSIERAKIKNKLNLDYILGIVLNKLKQTKKNTQIPEWFDKKIAKMVPTEQEQKELENLLKF